MTSFDHTTLAVPPADLRSKFVGTTDIEKYLKSSETFPLKVNEALAPHGCSLAQFQAVLDFGCGAGRLIRNMPAVTNARLCGVDLDAPAIEFCQRSFEFGEFKVSGEYPPVEFGDSEFDFLYAISVLTHLDVEHQDAWLGEWSRLVRSGGMLFVTYTPKHEQQWDEASQAEVDRVGYLFRSTSFWKDKFPDFYQTMFHSESYIRSHWSEYFDILSVIAPGALLKQGVVIMRRRR